MDRRYGRADRVLPERILLVFALFFGGIGIVISAGLALDNKPAELAIKKFLASQKAKDSNVQVQGSAAADLNGDGKPEMVLVWSSIASNRSSTSLTVLTQGAYGYSEAATLPLSGMTRLVGVKDKLILLEQRMPAGESSSVLRQVKYRWQGSKIQATG